MIAVMGIILAISMPTFSYLRSKYILGGASKVLASDLRYTQQHSVTEQTPYELRLNPSTLTYQIVRLGSPEFINKTVTLDNSITIVSPTGLTENKVSFNSSGAPSASGDIILEHNSGYTAIITVRPSGFITVQ